MATRKKTIEQTEAHDTVLGGDYAEWELVEVFKPFDKRKCTNCGYETTFPKDMKRCTFPVCPNCQKEMRW